MWLWLKSNKFAGQKPSFPQFAPNTMPNQILTNGPMGHFF